MNSTKVVGTYDKYEDESVVILTEINAPKTPTTVHAKLPEIARRLSSNNEEEEFVLSVNSFSLQFSVKKSSSQTSPLWSKLATNWRDYVYASFLSRVEQEKLSIAAYELEQTKLDWDRMRTNASFVLDRLDVNKSELVSNRT